MSADSESANYMAISYESVMSIYIAEIRVINGSSCLIALLVVSYIHVGIAESHIIYVGYIQESIF